MKCIVSLEGPEKIFLRNLYRESLNICKDPKILADLQLSLRSSGTIFTDPQGKLNMGIHESSVENFPDNSTRTP